jgi:hypothetical protein
MIIIIIQWIYQIIWFNEYDLKLYLTRFLTCLGGMLMVYLLNKIKKWKHWCIDMVLLVFITILFIVFLSRDRDILKNNKSRKDGMTPYLLGTTWTLIMMVVMAFMQTW